MSRLPTLTPRKVAAALKRAGFVEDRQHGSHLYVWHPARAVGVSIPMHARDLPRGTLKAILAQAGLTEDEFRRFL
jgi:predicted RNA binding protein YcfA (HicA-like mRNA interferase family)